ncbi:MAG: beta-galactosidase [Pyrinomonadaceae bacterium]|nr:beta-galactosidase [Pyrinomonadaceae bacterium]
MRYQGLFKSFFLGGFECSTHRLRNGKRLDEIAASRHDTFAREDYLRLQRQGMRAAREGLRWHLIEPSPGKYDFSSVIGMLHAARETGTQVIWDLCHYGWPDWLDIFEARFGNAFAELAREFGKVLANETDQLPIISPVNEISFFSWAAGEVAHLNPYALGRGSELKEQLVRAAIAATEALWDINPKTRIAHIDPVINVLPNDPSDAIQRRDAEAYRLSQYEAWDMLAGCLKPQLGGAQKYLDIIGINYYVHSQWVLGGAFIDQDNPRYRPFREIVKEVYERFERPLFVAETGIENEERPAWLRYVSSEVRAALRLGSQVEGICLYPIVNHPGWEDDRHCHNGLWDYPNEKAEREIYVPLAQELSKQQDDFRKLVHTRNSSHSESLKLVVCAANLAQP